MSNDYTLTYFNLRARAELSRLVFAAAGKTFVDKRIEFEQWPALKPTIPSGQLPLLQIENEGKCTSISQSMTIARFLARQFGLYGKNNIEEARVNEVVDTVIDLGEPFYKYYFEKDDTKKAEAKNKLVEETFPTFAKHFVRFMGQNKSNSGYFVGDSLSLADLAVYEGCTSYMPLGKDLLKDFPKLAAHRDMIEKQAKLKEYFKNRPESDV